MISSPSPETAIATSSLLNSRPAPLSAFHSPQTLEAWKKLELPRLKQSWATFLQGLPWHYYITLTFKTDINRPYAKRLVYRFIRKLNVDYLGKQYRRRQTGISFALAEELQLRGVVHYHLLLRYPDRRKVRVVRLVDAGRWVPYEPHDIDFSDRFGATHVKGAWERRINRNLCGFADVRVFDPAKGAGNYLSKYISKGGHIDIKFFDIPGTQKPAEPLLA